ncbi:MAG: ABC transporter permease [Thermoanaerobaculia bacterium]|nr:ABC transporter permease [Thermoanaerobaculia bacterium]
MYDLLNDLRIALRGLGQRPGFSLVAVLTLSLGIGATSAIYTVIQGVLLDPLGYPEPERLMVVQEKNPEAGFPRFSLSPLNYRDYRDMNSSFDHLAAATGASLAWSPDGGGPAQEWRARAVTHEFLEVFGVTPVVGRDFGPEDDQPGAPRTVMLSYELWQKLGGDPSIVDSDLLLDGETTRVVGVFPESLRAGREALIPLAMDWEEGGRGGHWLIGFGRLAEDVTVDGARADLERVAATLEAEYPDSNTGWGSIVDPLHERMVENVQSALWVLLGAVGVVLLIACANVANLTLTRLARQERDVAVRCALGAGRWRLLRQMVLESLVIALLAGGLGLILARYGIPVLIALDAGNLPRAESISIDGQVLGVSLVVTLLTALLFGLMPALSAARPDLTIAMKDGGRGHVGGRRGQNLRTTLVLGEVALALMLSIAAGLLVKSYGNLLSVDTGFDPEPLWTASVSLPDGSYGEDPQRVSFYERLLDEARALPGVEAAATVMPMPLSGSDYILTFNIEGRPTPEANQAPNANIRFVSDGYFDTLGIPLHRGRALSRSDRAEAELALVINESAAATFWPDEDPLNARITFGSPDDEEAEWYKIVGIAGNVRHSSLDGEPEPAIYRSVYQATPGFATVVLRTDGEPSALAGPLRGVVSRIDANLPLADEQSGGGYLTDAVAEPRFNATLLGVFAGLALLLAAVGVFGVISYTVAQQVREIGVRMALGAAVGHIVRWVVVRGFRPVAWGIAVGLAGAVVATRLLSSLVYGIPTVDVVTYLTVAAGLAAVALVACLLPALRASRVEPVAVLRDE